MICILYYGLISNSLRDIENLLKFKSPQRQYLPWGLPIGTFRNLLFIPHSRKFGIQVGRAIYLERLIRKRTKQEGVPPKGNLKPFGGFTRSSFGNPTLSFYASEG